MTRTPGAVAAGGQPVGQLPGHPFFLGTLFQPELHGDGTKPHPIVVALAAAARAHAIATARAGVLP